MLHQAASTGSARWLIALSLASALIVDLHGAQRPAQVECSETQECRRLAQDAAARGAYEAFHDLVWRAIQTGRPNDPELLFLLARAQGVSGRPHDALVVLGRLADMGVVFDALTNEDLGSVRRLPGWPALAARLSRVKPRTIAREPAAPVAEPAPVAVEPPPSPAAISAPTPVKPAVTPPAAEPPAPREAAARPAAAPPPPLKANESVAAPREPRPAATVPAAPIEFELRPSEEALRFSVARFAPGGLAYDAVSARFILGNVPARSLIVVGEGTSRVSDLVRADSTGFEEVGALEIDRRRGDLWVVSTRADGESGVLHKLQLISGRNLTSYPVPSGSDAVRLLDLAVTPAGAVLVLDGGGRRVLRLRPGATAMEPIVELEMDGARSITSTDDERIAYVVVPSGLIRVDGAGTARPVTAAAGLDLEGIERLRWHRGSLIAVQRMPDGTRRIVQLRLSRNGQAVSAATVIHAAVPADSGPTFSTIAGEDLYFLAFAPTDTSGTGAGGGEIVVQRIALQ